MTITRGLLFVLALLAAACGAAPSAPINRPAEPTRFPLPDAVATCGDVIRAALDTLNCDLDGNDVCAIAAEYVPDDPGANLIGTVPLGALADVTSLDSTDNTSSGELVEWRAHRLRTSTDSGATLTLIATGSVLLGTITPALDALTLDTSTTPACTDAPPPVLMVQVTGGDEANLTVNGAQITVGTTAAITATPDDVMTIYALDGLSVVSAGGVTRVVRRGEQVTVPLAGLDVDGEPEPSVAVAGTLVGRLPLGVLPEPLTTTDLPEQAQAQQIQQGNCTPNPTWTGEYTVQRGESLAAIAPRFGLSYQQLQAGNCLQNPSRIRPGQSLRVPLQGTPPPPPSVTPPQSAVQAPAQPGSGQIPVNATVVIIPAFSDVDSLLRVDTTTPIQAGTCTTLRWDAPGATQAFLDGQVVPVQGAAQVCPSITTAYTLRVRFADGTEQQYNRAVVVQGS